MAVTRPPGTTLHFTLKCGPAGGSVRDAKELCRRLRAHRNMLFPPRMTGTCLGGPGIPPEVTVGGSYDGRRVAMSVRSCDQPRERAEAADLWLQALHMNSAGR